MTSWLPLLLLLSQRHTLLLLLLLSRFSRAAPEVLQPRGRQRKSDHLSGMGDTGAGPRWLAEARHESAFQHWQTTATTALVRHQGHARGEAKVFGQKRAQETERQRALFNAERDAEET